MFSTSPYYNSNSIHQHEFGSSPQNSSPQNASPPVQVSPTTALQHNHIVRPTPPHSVQQSFNQPTIQYVIQNEPKKKRKRYSKKACANCKKAHSACNDERPCKRCREKGIQCYDVDDHNQADVATPSGVISPVLQQKQRKRQPQSADNDNFFELQQEQQAMMKQEVFQSSLNHTVTPLTNNEELQDIDNFLNCWDQDNHQQGNEVMSNSASQLALLLPDTSVSTKSSSFEQASPPIMVTAQQQIPNMQLNMQQEQQIPNMQLNMQQQLLQVAQQIVPNNHQQLLQQQESIMFLMKQELQDKQRQYDQVLAENQLLRMIVRNLASAGNAVNTFTPKSNNIVWNRVAQESGMLNPLASSVPLFWTEPLQFSNRAVSIWERSSSLMLLGCNPLFAQMVHFSMDELQNKFTMYNFCAKQAPTPFFQKFIQAIVQARAKTVGVKLCWSIKNEQKLLVNTVFHLEETFFWCEHRQTDRWDDEVIMDDKTQLEKSNEIHISEYESLGTRMTLTTTCKKTHKMMERIFSYLLSNNMLMESNSSTPIASVASTTITPLPMNQSSSALPLHDVPSSFEDELSQHLLEDEDDLLFVQ